MNDDETKDNQAKKDETDEFDGPEFSHISEGDKEALRKIARTTAHDIADRILTMVDSLETSNPYLPFLKGFEPTVDADGDIQCNCPACVADRDGSPSIGAPVGTSENPILMDQNDFDRAPLTLQCAVVAWMARQAAPALHEFLSEGGRITFIAPPSRIDETTIDGKRVTEKVVTKLSELIAAFVGVLAVHTVAPPPSEEGYEVESIAVTQYDGTKEDLMAKFEERTKAAILGRKSSTVGVPAGTQRLMEKIFSTKKKPTVGQ